MDIRDIPAGFRDQKYGENGYIDLVKGQELGRAFTNMEELGVD